MWQTWGRERERERERERDTGQGTVKKFFIRPLPVFVLTLGYCNYLPKTLTEERNQINLFFCFFYVMPDGIFEYQKLKFCAFLRRFL
jgi:hypothetical protein